MTHISRVAIPVNNPYDPNYVVQPGDFEGAYDAVVHITGSGWMGTGSLLWTGTHILTAAHVVEDMAVNDISVRFDLPDGAVYLDAADLFIHQQYGQFGFPAYDIAIIELAEAAPIDGYQLYSGGFSAGMEFTLVGYGTAGTGTGGQLDDDPQAGDIKRFGNNIYEALIGLGAVGQQVANWFNEPNIPDGSMAFYDFDNGNPTNDAFGQMFDAPDLGLGGNEVNSTQGDSGGPIFVDGQIAGLVSGGTWTSHSVGGSTASYFGEISFDTYVPYFSDWIANIVGEASPGPGPGPDEPDEPGEPEGPFTLYDSDAHTALDLVGQILGSVTGLTVTSANYIGADNAASFVTAFDFGENVAKPNPGILLTSGDGTPPLTNTSSSYTVNNGQPGDPQFTQIAQGAFPSAGSTNDASILEFTFTITSTAVQSISLDLIFGSDEYPEYSNTSYVDIAAMIVNGQNYAYFNDNVNQPLSVINANLQAGNFVNNNVQGGNSPVSIEYDGISTLLTIFAPVVQGENTIRIGVADTGDFAYDSGLFVSNLQTHSFASDGLKQVLEAPDDPDGTLQAPENMAAVLVGGASGGTLIGGNMNDVLIANGGSNVMIGGGGQNIFQINGGTNTIKGSLNNLNGDTIQGLTGQDKIVIEGGSGVGDQMSVAYGSAYLNFDLNEDGQADVTINLVGNYLSGMFRVAGSGEDAELVFVDRPESYLILTEQAQDYALPTGNFTRVFASGGADGIAVAAGSSVDLVGMGAGDVVNLEGAAGDYQVTLSGTTVTLVDGKGNVVRLAATASPVELRFADGALDLQLSGGAVRLGGEALSNNAFVDIPAGLDADTTSAPAFGAPAGATPPPEGPSAWLVMTATSEGFVLQPGSHTSVIGSGESTAAVALGASARFATFGGGSVIDLQGASDAYTVDRSGTTVRLYDGEGGVISVPAGGAAIVLRFADGASELQLSGGQVLLGDQVIGTGAPAAVAAPQEAGDTSVATFAAWSAPDPAPALAPNAAPAPDALAKLAGIADGASETASETAGGDADGWDGLSVPAVLPADALIDPALLAA